MNADAAASNIFTIGALLLVSLGAKWLSDRTRIPRVSLVLLVGVCAGPLLLDILPDGQDEWFPIVSRIALVMVGFLIGGEFTADRLRSQGRDAALLAVGQGLFAALVVSAGLLALGVDPTVALLIGGVATATDPAATRSVIEDEDASGAGPHTILGIVALDDVVGIVTFSVLLTVSGIFSGEGASAAAVAEGGWEIVGGLLVGVGLGLVAAQLSGRLEPGEPLLEEALGIVFLCASITWWLDVSYLIAAVSTGAVVANMAAHHNRPFRAVESIEWPFLVLFFVLAGAAIDSGSLSQVGLVAAYVLLRTAGKVAGTTITGSMVGYTRHQARWFGAALLPQAGVALGMALAAAERFPQHEAQIVSVAVVSTVVFELIGPVGVRAAIGRLDQAD